MAAVETITQPPRTMLEVFESLPEGTNIQLIEDSLIMSPAPLNIHQLYIDLIYPELSIYIRKNKLGQTRCAPFDVYLDNKNVFQPDICFVLKENEGRIKKKGLYGAPDFVLEILSPATAKYDLNEKKAACEHFGVTEYWIVDPEENVATGYYLVNNEYHQFFSEKGILQSRLLNIIIEF